MDFPLTDLEDNAPRGLISFALMTASSRTGGTELLIGAPSATLTDVDATVGTYQLRFYYGEQSRSDCYVAWLQRSGEYQIKRSV